MNWYFSHELLFYEDKLDFIYIDIQYNILHCLLSLVIIFLQITCYQNLAVFVIKEINLTNIEFMAWV